MSFVLAMLFSPATWLRMLTGSVRIAELEQRADELSGLHCRGALCDTPELAVNVDRLEDLRIVERIIALMKWPLWLVGVGAVIVLTTYCASLFSPWPGALLIRAQFSKNGHAMMAALEKHVPPGVSQVLDVQYAGNGRDTQLDVFYPSAIERTQRTLPTIVWIHGGAFIAGDKSEVANYLKILAAKGYTVVGTNYAIAPGAKYPAPIVQTMAALTFLKQHAAQYHIDASRLILAGDSAGAQMAAQVAAMITNPAYAKLVGVAPTADARQLAGTVLNCGPYDAAELGFTGDSAGAKFLRTALWAYTGNKGFKDNRVVAQISVVDYVTPAFPPTYISGGNGDPLTPQGVAMADKLRSLGVRVDGLFFPADYAPPLQHEYQFDLDTDAGQEALAKTLTFLSSVAKQKTR